MGGQISLYSYSCFDDFSRADAPAVTTTGNSFDDCVAGIKTNYPEGYYGIEYIASTMTCNSYNGVTAAPVDTPGSVLCYSNRNCGVGDTSDNTGTCTPSAEYGGPCVVGTAVGTINAPSPADLCDFYGTGLVCGISAPGATTGTCYSPMEGAPCIPATEGGTNTCLADVICDTTTKTCLRGSPGSTCILLYFIPGQIIIPTNTCQQDFVACDTVAQLCVVSQLGESCSSAPAQTPAEGATPCVPGLVCPAVTGEVCLLGPVGTGCDPDAITTTCDTGLACSRTSNQCEEVNGSMRARQRRRRLLQSTWTAPRMSCPGKTTACQIPGTSGFECVDLSNELEHCGACGTNCLTKSGARGVSCSNGSCEISSCRAGWLFSDNDCTRID